MSTSQIQLKLNNRIIRTYSTSDKRIDRPKWTDHLLIGEGGDGEGGEPKRKRCRRNRTRLNLYAKISATVQICGLLIFGKFTILRNGLTRISQCYLLFDLFAFKFNTIYYYLSQT